MINWRLLEPKNFIAIGLIVLLTRLVFFKAFNALDGRGASPTTDQ